MEEELLKGFRTTFMQSTFPMIAQKKLAIRAAIRAELKGTEPDDELEAVQNEFASLGEYLFDFDSGTSPAYKQLRHMLLMAECGALTLIMDEVGSNLQANEEILKVLLETYDQGKAKTKLIKHTSDNPRSAQIEGATPANMLMFGTPSKLFDGGKVEQTLMDFLDTGYARRCFYSLVEEAGTSIERTSEEIFDMLTSTASSTFAKDTAALFEQLAHIENYNKELPVSREVSIILIDYKKDCEARARALPTHLDIRKAEMSHRHSRALKLAGAYAFVDRSDRVTEEHLYNAIKIAEDSGEAFERIMNRDKAHVRLAKYLAAVDTEVTQADLVADLAFYKGAESVKRDMLELAIAYGYKHNIVITKSYVSDIMFLRGSSLVETDVSKMIVSYSTDITTGFEPNIVEWSQISQLTQARGYHWLNHHMVDQYRLEANAIPKFNMIVLDVDGGTTLTTAQLLLGDYTYHMYTTKRHTEANNRFRIVMPISHELHLDKEAYKAFMDNIYDWLPFDVDTGTGQRSRKWLSNQGVVVNNEGELLDALTFIPETTKSEEFKKTVVSLNDMTNVEQWFVRKMTSGNRSNQMIKYALMLVDTGLSHTDIQNRVMALNSKIKSPLKEREIFSTIMQSVAAAIAKAT